LGHQVQDRRSCRSPYDRQHRETDGRSQNHEFDAPHDGHQRFTGGNELSGYLSSNGIVIANDPSRCMGTTLLEGVVAVCGGVAGALFSVAV
jgi:hypothetical protein